MNKVIEEFGINPKAWDWRVFLNKLVSPSFSHSNRDVRQAACNLTLSMYKIVGHEVQQLIQEMEGLKPNLLQKLT
jgi:hypothetical protein